MQTGGKHQRVILAKRERERDGREGGKVTGS